MPPPVSNTTPSSSASTPTPETSAQAQTVEPSTPPSADLPGMGQLGGILLAAGVLVLVVTMVRIRIRQVRRQRSAPTNRPPAERIQSIRDDAAQREFVNNFLADAQELTQRMAAQLDNKAARLEQLIIEAQQTIDTIERASSRVPTTHSHTASSNQSHKSETQTNSSDPVTEQVYQLADKGLDPVEIAKQLGQHTGKVELILALRPSA